MGHAEETLRGAGEPRAVTSQTGPTKDTSLGSWKLPLPGPTSVGGLCNVVAARVTVFFPLGRYVRRGPLHPAGLTLGPLHRCGGLASDHSRLHGCGYVAEFQIAPRALLRELCPREAPCIPWLGMGALRVPHILALL